jgi:hypothetical protein
MKFNSIKIRVFRLRRDSIPSTIMIKWLVIVFSILQIGCSKEIEINLDNTKALVLNSVFKPNEFFTFRLSTTASLLNNYDSINENLHFSLYEEDKLIVDSILQSSILETYLMPVPGKKYSVEVKSDNFPSIKAIDTIPNLVPIDNAYMIFPAGVDAFGGYKAEANISFTDPSNEKNYYELIINSGQSNKNAWYMEYETNDAVLLNEGDQDYHPTSFFFSDELFNGEHYTMRIKNGVGGYITKDNKLTPSPLYATLRSVSRAYYKYRKYYTRHAYNQQFQNEFLDLIFKGEPQNMYTNVENGYGIFAGYCETTCEIIHNE